MSLEISSYFAIFHVFGDSSPLQSSVNVLIKVLAHLLALVVEPWCNPISETKFNL